MNIDKFWFQKIRPKIMTDASSQMSLTEGISNVFSETVRTLGLNKFILEKEVNSIPVYSFQNEKAKFYRVDLLLSIQFAKAIVTLMVCLLPRPN